eukprot:UN30815
MHPIPLTGSTSCPAIECDWITDAQFDRCPSVCTEGTELRRNITCRNTLTWDIIDDDDCGGARQPASIKICECRECDSGELTIDDYEFSFPDFKGVYVHQCEDGRVGSIAVTCTRANSTFLPSANGRCKEIREEQQVVPVKFSFKGLTEETFYQIQEELLESLCQTLGDVNGTKCSWAGAPKFSDDDEGQRRNLAESVEATVNYLADDASEVTALTEIVTDDGYTESVMETLDSNVELTEAFEDVELETEYVEDGSSEEATHVEGDDSDSSTGIIVGIVCG